VYPVTFDQVATADDAECSQIVKAPARVWCAELPVFWELGDIHNYAVERI
jgi:hypothetical protein